MPDMPFTRKQSYRLLAKDEDLDSPPTAIEVDRLTPRQNQSKFKLLFYTLLTINLLVLLPIGAGLSWNRAYISKEVVLSQGVFPSGIH